MFLFEAVVRKIFGKEESLAPIKCVSVGNKGDYVVLIYGIYQPPFAMKTIKNTLDKAGYYVLNFEYDFRCYSIDEIVKSSLDKFLKKHCIDPKKKIHFVTYSSGGLIIRRYLEKYPLLKLGRVVMIAPPNHGSKLVDFLKKYLNFIYRFIAGVLGQQLGTGKNDYIHKTLKQSINFDLGIIAGLGSLSPFSYFIIDEPHDGMTSIESTKLKGMKDHIVITASHMLILYFNFTAKKVLNFLTKGSF